MREPAAISAAGYWPEWSWAVSRDTARRTTTAVMDRCVIVALIHTRNRRAPAAADANISGHGHQILVPPPDATCHRSHCHRSDRLVALRSTAGLRPADSQRPHRRRHG